MLIEFNVTNFRSFSDCSTLCMEATPDDSLIETNIIASGKRRMLRSAVVYGANASGKSNLVSAMHFMKHMVLNSSRETQANEKIDVTPFLLSAECEEQPSKFEIEFVSNKVEYRYGFEVDQELVHSEWLFSRATVREARLFTREKGKISINENRFKEGRELEERTRPNALFLSVCAQFNGEIAQIILGWFQNFKIMHGFAPSILYGSTVEKIKSPASQRQVLNLTQVADPGIIGFDLIEKKLTLDSFPEDMPDEIKSRILKDSPMMVNLKTKHQQFNKNKEQTRTIALDFGDTASDGTQKITSLSGPLLDILEKGQVFVVDELDARLHPLLTRLIVSLFNSPANKTNAQLIFTTHDTTLLTPEFFRRDQIWFTEKDQLGATDLYSLAEIKGVRKEAIFARDYIMGKYGAIPFIGDVNWLSDEVTDG